MAVKKRSMSNSPTQENYQHEAGVYEKGQSILPLHLRMEVSSNDESSPDSSPKAVWPKPSAPFPPKEHSLPRWSSGSSSSDEDSETSRTSVAFASAPSDRLKGPLFVIGLALVMIAAVYTSRITVIEAVEQVSLMQMSRDRMNEQLTKTEKDFLMLRRQISAMDVMIRREDGSDAGGLSDRSQRLLKETADLKERLLGETKLVDRLKEQVQAGGKQEVMAKYGPGPHRVEIELIFPDRQIGPSRFVIELAPIEVMPHSVHTFLEMVSAGLLDGCSFILNALHVLKAAPLPYDGTSAAEKAKAFTSLGLESVSFKEYSESYPHKQYTVGFAADGSPSFYINTEDNSEIHVGDPCFGKVVEGFEAVKRLEAQPTRNGIWFAKRIGIKSARVLMT